MRGLPGTSLPETMAAGRRLSERLLQDPSVRSVAQQAGRAELGEDTWGVDYSELEVDLHASQARDIQKAEWFIKNLADNVPGFACEPMPFLTERIKETLSGTTAAVVVKVFGDDLAQLDRTAREIANVLNKVDGHDKVRIEPQTGNPELVIRIRPEDAGRFGLRSAQILEAIHAAYKGAEVGQVYDRNRIIDIVVILDAKFRMDTETVADLWLSLPEGVPGGRMQLKQVADVFLAEGRFLIVHEGACAGNWC